MNYGTKPHTLAAIVLGIVTLTACSTTNTIDIIRQTERSCPAEWRIDVSQMRGESREVIDCRDGGGEW